MCVKVVCGVEYCAVSTIENKFQIGFAWKSINMVSMFLFLRCLWYWGGIQFLVSVITSMYHIWTNSCLDVLLLLLFVLAAVFLYDLWCCYSVILWLLVGMCLIFINFVIKFCSPIFGSMKNLVFSWFFKKLA